MKVIGIISSFDSRGNTAKLVLKALEGAKDGGAETESIYLNDLQLSYCTGCMSCLKFGKCVLPDELEKLRQKLYEADGIILGSPTHALSPNAIMKNFLDRIGLFSVYSGDLEDKYIAGISTAGRMGAKSTAKMLTSLGGSFFGRCYISGVLGLAIGWDKIDNYPLGFNKAYALGKKVIHDIQSKNTYPLQNIPSRLLQILVLKKFMKKNIISHKDSMMKAVYDYHVSKGSIHS